jgi:EmrB/QacA subfamily drug resistance transporter
MPQQPGPAPAAERIAMLVALPAAFLIPFMGSSSNIALPAISHSLGMGAVALSWVSTAYLLAAAVFLVPFGRLADIVGRKRILTIGLVVFSVASLLCAIAPTGAFLIAMRAAHGFGAAMTFATNVAILTSVVAPERRGRALGANVAATYVGLSIGPVLGGLITEALGWRWVFAVCVPVGLAAVILLMTRLRGEWAEARGESFDLTGSVVLVVSLSLLMYGVSRLPEGLGIGLTVTGAAGVAAFVAWELHVPLPALNMALIMHNRTFALSNVAALINYAATATVGFFLSLYLQYIRGLSARSAGLLLIAQPVVQALFSPLTGRLSDRVEPRVLASTGMGLTVVGLALLSFVAPGTPLAYVTGSLGVLGLGFALFSSPNTNAIMTAVERKHYGIASAMMGTMRLVGNSLSMAAAVTLLSLLVGNVAITPDRYDALLRCVRIVFPLSAAVCVVGVWASLARGKRQVAAPQR